MNFTFQAYKNLLNMLKRNGYEYADYLSNDNYEQCVILRHDIDMSIDKALEFARIESSMGAKSTYFVLLGTHFYNIAERSNREKITEIRDLGHDIGLHFDELNYPEETDIEPAIIEEAHIMEQLLGFQIRTVSMHRPSQKTLDANFHLNGEIVNSYSDKYFKSFKYLSDSRRRWRENVEDVIRSKAYPKLHILTHAFWYNKDELTLQESCKRFIITANDDRYNALADNITDLESIMKGSM